MAYGLTSAGFVLKQQAQITAELQQALQAAFGANINLSPQTVFGQIVNILAEREALVWQLIEAVYSSQYPTGAEGTSIDNILALNNLRRLSATPTKTAPMSTTGVPGFVFYGTAGTVIPAGSIVSVNGNATVQFTTDLAVTIAAAVNAVQAINLYGGVAASGSFSMSIVDTNSEVLTTPTIAYNATANTAQLTWPTAPGSGQFFLTFSLAGVGYTTTAIPYTANAAAVQSAITALSPFAGVTVSGSFSAGFVINWGTSPQPITTTEATKLSFSGTPSGGSLVLVVGGTNTSAITTFTAAAIQTAIQALSGFSTVVVTGTVGAGFYVNWGYAGNTATTVFAQPTGATVSVTQNTDTLNQTTTVIGSLQAAVNNLFDQASGKYPYTDVAASGSYSSSIFTLTFGSLTPVAGQSSSGAQVQSAFTVVTNTLLNGSTVININITTITIGSVAQVTGSATCTVNGPNFVPATYLSVIGSPVSGWVSVTNPLDCITGTNLESDTAALLRRATLLAANANSPLASIVEKVSQVTGVVQAIGFQNISLAAEQIVSFTGIPSAGYLQLIFTGPTGLLLTTGQIPYNAAANTQFVSFAGTPNGGFFTLTFGAQTTAHITNTATAATVQAAIQALTGYSTAIVSGSFSLGFNIAFGIATQLPVTATNSLTGVSSITTVPSVQSRINAISAYALALVTGSFGNGFDIAFNGSAGGQAQQLASAVNNLTGVSAIATAYGRPGKSFEIVVNDNNGEASNTAIAQTILESAAAGIQSYGTTQVLVQDQFLNPYNIYFSRPSQIPVYIVLTLQTDLTTNPTPKFNPQSIIQIQEDLVNIGNGFSIGGLIVGFGSNGLIGAFNNVPGILSYTLYFGTSPNPSTNTNVQLQAEQVALFEAFQITVSYI